MKRNSTVVMLPARNLLGAVRLPGDKSISHRYAMLGAIAHGTTKLENYSTGADCASTLGCLTSLGVNWRKEDEAIEIEGAGPKLQPPSSPLDCGNSGSTMRILSGILAGQDFTSLLIGDESLSRRPMSRIIKPLEMMGAKVTATDGGRPPLAIAGGSLKAISYDTPVPSAQVKTALLFAGLYAAGETRIQESVRTRDHGETALRAFGAVVEQQRNESRIRGGQELHAIETQIPGDLSSAAFFLCAAALFAGSQLTMDSLLLNPTRARLLDVLMGMGVGITITQLEEKHGELIGTAHVTGKTLTGASISGAHTAELIDEIPVLAAIAPYTANGIEIRDARELRVKESDRIASVATNLRAMGARVEEFEDGLKIPGSQELQGAELDSFGDHRIAMAFAVAALRAHGETRINRSDAAVISYPAFYDALESILVR
jgi:3-phosphoshikimate 1-carboxyvinyltransferase